MSHTYSRCWTCLAWTDCDDLTVVVDTAGNPVNDNGLRRWVCPECAAKYGTPHTAEERFRFLEDVFLCTMGAVTDAAKDGALPVNYDGKQLDKAEAWAQAHGYRMPDMDALIALIREVGDDIIIADGADGFLPTITIYDTYME